MDLFEMGVFVQEEQNGRGYLKSSYHFSDEPRIITILMKDTPNYSDFQEGSSCMLLNKYLNGKRFKGTPHHNIVKLGEIDKAIAEVEELCPEYGVSVEKTKLSDIPPAFALDFSIDDDFKLLSTTEDKFEYGKIMGEEPDELDKRQCRLGFAHHACFHSYELGVVYI
jgi:hypothetical protein